MKQIAIRLDDETWKLFKVALAHSGDSAQAVLSAAVAEYIAKAKS